MAQEILYKVGLTGLEDSNTQIGLLSQRIDELNASYKSMRSSTDADTKAMGENRSEVKALEAEKSRLIKTTLNSIQSDQAEEGSLTQLRLALSKATAEYNRMGEVKRNSVKGKELETSIVQQTQAISALEQKMGNFRRNVGNYASGWNGLANSINQVTREMPNFAQSATIGFMALSNNLPILVDEINKVRDANRLLAAEGKAGIPIWRQIATSLFSWQSALITLISLSVIYSKEISAMITGTKVLTEEEKKLIETQRELDIIIHENENSWKSYRGEITEVEAALDNLAFSNKQHLDKIEADTKEKVTGARNWWRSLMGAWGESLIRKEQNKAIVEGEKEKELFLGLQTANANAKLQEAIKKHQEAVADIHIQANKNERQRDLDAAYVKYTRTRDSYKKLKGSDADFKAADLEAYNEYLANKNLINKKQDEKEAKDRENKAKESLEFEREYQRLLIENKYEGFAEEVKLAELENKFELEDLKKKGATQKLIEEKEKEHQIKIREIKEKWINLNAEINEKARDEEHKANTKIQEDLSNIRLKELADAMKSVDEYEKWKEKEAEKRKKDKEKEDEKNRKLAIDSAVKAAQDIANAVERVQQQAIERRLKRELTAIQRNADAQDMILENRLKNGIISEGQYADEKIRLNEATAAAELEADRKAFEEKKKLDTTMAVINTALAVTSILGYAKDATGLQTAIRIASALAAGIASIAVIQSQKFALGGKVSGRSHAEGGVQIEVEGDEGIINKRSMRSQQVMQAVGTPSQIASAINATGGGVSWESGASIRPNPNMFRNNSSRESISYSQMAALMSGLGNKLDNIQVKVLESEITNTQKKVKAYETSGKW